VPQLTLALLIALAGFGSAWQIQSWRYGAKEHARDQQTLVDQRTAAASAIRRTDNVIDAQNKAAARLVVLRVDADRARAALVSLSDATASALRGAATSHDACIERATATSELLNSCGAAYQDLGERADRHASDVRTLMEAWPR
jgi:hypothetical protein